MQGNNKSIKIIRTILRLFRILSILNQIIYVSLNERIASVCFLCVVLQCVERHRLVSISLMDLVCMCNM